MTAAVESEASESSFFSLSLACRPRGFRLERERNEVCINPSLILDNFVGRQGGYTQVAFYPRTGRTHQLRVHASHELGLAAPIVGDRLYGRGGGRLLLHAECLRFSHPETKREVCVRSPLLADFRPRI